MGFRFGLIAAACLLTPVAASAAPEKFTMVIGQPAVGANEAHIFHVPKAMGFYADQNLDVDILTANGGTQEIQLMLSDKADIGLLSVPGMLLARQKEVPVRAVYNVIRTHSTSIATLENGPIKKIEDLKGRSIGVASMASTRTYDGYAMIRAGGLDPQKDVKWLSVGFGAQAGAALTRGDVAALAEWDATYVDMENAGVKMKYWTFPFQKDLFGYFYFATDKVIDGSRDRLVRYLRAVTMGFVFSNANPAAAACIYMMDGNHAAMSRDIKKALSDAERVVRQNIETGRPESESILWGSFPDRAWEINQDYYYKLGVVPATIDPQNYWLRDEAFYKAINDFDHQKVIKLANEFKCPL